MIRLALSVLLTSALLSQSILAINNFAKVEKICEKNMALGKKCQWKNFYHSHERLAA